MIFKKKTSGVTAEIRVKRCYGCGAILQDKNPDEPGYLPSEKFLSDEENLCERCYKLRHYFKYKGTNDFNIDYVTILDAAKEQQALVVYVLNAFTLHGSLLKGIDKYLSDRVIVVINKRDLLAKEYSDEYLLKRAKNLMEKNNIRALDYIITSSSAHEKNIEELQALIEKRREGKSVYFIGAYQVGKSSLINALLSRYKNSTEKMITTSPYPGTTLDVISVPLDNEHFLYDTPGIYNSASLISFVEPEIVKYILPRNEIKVETYLAKSEQSFLISNICRIDYIKGGKTNFSFFKSNDITIQRCKLNKADSLFKDNCENSNLPYHSERVSSLTGLKKVAFETEDKIPYRLIVTSLLSVEFIANENQLLEIYVPDPVEVILEKQSI